MASDKQQAVALGGLYSIMQAMEVRGSGPWGRHQLGAPARLSPRRAAPPSLPCPAWSCPALLRLRQAIPPATCRCRLPPSQTRNARPPSPSSAAARAWKASTAPSPPPACRASLTACTTAAPWTAAAGSSTLARASAGAVLSHRLRWPAASPRPLGPTCRSQLTTQPVQRPAG